MSEHTELHGSGEIENGEVTTNPLVEGALKVKVQWNKSATFAEMDNAQEFIKTLLKTFNSPEFEEMPECVECVIIKRLS